MVALSNILHRAVSIGIVQALRYLIGRGVDRDIKDKVRCILLARMHRFLINFTWTLSSLLERSQVTGL
jgi:hypothetical protein